MRPNYLPPRGSPRDSGTRGPGGGGRAPGADPPVRIDDATAQAILDGDSRLLVNTAERLGRQLYEQNLKSSQIRNVFGTVRRIEMRWPRTGADEAIQRQQAHELLLIRPKLAYQTARHKRQEGGEGVQLLENALRPLIDRVGEDRVRFQRFVDFFEAILAYHRASGGS